MKPNFKLSFLAVVMTICIVAVANSSASSLGVLGFPSGYWVESEPFDTIYPLEQDPNFGVESCDALLPNSICAEFTDGVNVYQTCCIDAGTLSMGNEDRYDINSCLLGVGIIRDGEIVQ